MKLYSRPLSAPDYVFLALIVFLVVFGMVMLASASSDLAKFKFGDSLYYVKHQLLYGLLTGIVGFIIGFLLPYEMWEKLAVPLLVISIVLLLLVFTPLGFSAKGSSRWLSIGSFTFQPSEFLKLAFFVYLAAWLARTKARGKSVLEGFVPFLLILGGVMTLLFFQPSTTTAVLIFCVALLTYFVSGAHLRFLLTAFLVGIVGITVLISVTPYRLERVKAFLNPQSDVLKSTYHINQALIAIGSGGLTGVGFGKSTTKLNYLPEPIGDSIFAVIAEELGFIGSMVVLLSFLMLMWRGFIIARAAKDNFGRLLATGFTALISVQAFVNIGAISGVIPLTGVPLPFVSYGGTALAVILTMSGILANISRRKRSQ